MYKRQIDPSLVSPATDASWLFDHPDRNDHAAPSTTHLLENPMYEHMYHGMSGIVHAFQAADFSQMENHPRNVGNKGLHEMKPYNLARADTSWYEDFAPTKQHGHVRRAMIKRHENKAESPEELAYFQEVEKRYRHHNQILARSKGKSQNYLEYLRRHYSDLLEQVRTLDLAKKQAGLSSILLSAVVGGTPPIASLDGKWPMKWTNYKAGHTKVQLGETKYKIANGRTTDRFLKMMLQIPDCLLYTSPSPRD